MCEACNHIVSVYARNKRYNPTQTGGISRAYGAEMSRRFADLRKTITEAVVTQDVFGLNKPTVFVQSGQFDFIRSADKVSAFMEWIQKQVDAKIFSVAEGTQLGQAVEQAWQNKYLTDSYSKGITRARYELDKAGFTVPALSDTGGVGASLRAPFHMDKIGLVYSRAYTELKNVTNTMDNQISRVLAKGIADGDSPRVLAAKMNAVIKGGGETLAIKDTLGRFIPAERRAAMIARTEVIRAHHVATIQEYRNWGAEGVHVQAEFSALGDACLECQELASGGVNNDGIYTLDEIEGMIPVHPNCRCLALPYLPEEDKPAEETTVVDEEGKGVFDLTSGNVMRNPDIQDLLNMSRTNTLNMEGGGLKTEDNLLKGIAKKQGFDKHPIQMTEEQFEAYEGTTVFRGTTGGDLYKKQFIEGEYFGGTGISGNGYYFVSEMTAEGGVSLDRARQIAKRYSGSEAGIMEAKLSKDIRIIEYKEAEQMRDEFLEKSGIKYSNLMKDIKEGIITEDQADILYFLFDDVGRYAALKGYDAIRVVNDFNNDYIVVLNRGKIIVKKI